MIILTKIKKYYFKIFYKKYFKKPYLLHFQAAVRPT